MINPTKHSASILTYLLVLVGGISILFMLTIEHKEAKRLIENNQFLMKNTVVKTLISHVTDKLADYPASSAELNLNWKEVPLDFIANHQEKWIFPFRFSGKQGGSSSQLWQLYSLDNQLTTKELFNLSSESQQRIAALHKIKVALKTNQQANITRSLEDYFSLVENYQLSPLEEIISSLRFLEIDSNARWNNQLIELVIFEGSTQVIPLVDYIFKSNEQLSKIDVEQSVRVIQRILENANINTSWFNQSVDELWIPDLELDISSLKNYSIIQNKFLFVRSKNDLALFLPFSIQDELRGVEATLKSQGILDNDDQLSISAQSEGVNKTLSELTFDIERGAWNHQAEQQNYFFVIKIALTLIFTISLFILVAFISYRNRKRVEHINLRENFINLVSHELKTPLASIRIMIETLQKRHDRNLSIKNYPEKIISEVDRLWLMVDNLLSLNQIKSGELELNIDKVNLNSLVERVNDKFSEHQSKPLHFQSRLPNNCFGLIDPLLFELVIINLFSNSIKYCDKPMVEIEISFNTEENTLILSDNACGIKPSNWKRVFDDFFRDTNTNSKQGTGVGLSLCKQIMNVHQATIKIIHSNEQGTTWAIGLPSIVNGKGEVTNER